VKRMRQWICTLAATLFLLVCWPEQAAPLCAATLAGVLTVLIQRSIKER
jgi:hypothetical protein